MKYAVKKIAIALLSLVVLLYVLYQGYVRIKNPYRTEIVFRYSVSDSLRANGIVIRDEYILPQQRSDAADYLFNDGDRVSKNTLVANLYRSRDDIADKHSVTLLQAEIQMLEQSAQVNSDYITNADIVSRQILTKLIAYADTCESQFVGSVFSDRNDFLLPLNKRLAVGENRLDLSGNLASLKAQLATMKSHYGDPVDKVYTQKAGYFVSRIDGYENLLTTQNYASYTVSDYQALISGKSTATLTDSIGKIITDPNWYLAVEVPASSASDFYVGRLIDIDFPFSQIETIESTVFDTKTEPDSDSMIVFLKCSSMSENLAAVRTCTVRLNFRTLTGLRLNAKAVRFNENNEQGVYVLSGEQVTFKKINIIYEGNGFYLTEYNDSDKEYLQFYDEVILEGKNLQKAVS
ncbi:MAG TPA: hypothetical protein DCE08_03470 [Ruminococcaceae bacterium]|nr:hypothetical protein [Oscillospiraceae bacterium]